MRIFVDTSAFFALLDSDDSNHKKADKVWRSILDPENILVSSNYILVESFALIQHRLGTEAVNAFQEDILPVINIEWIDSGVHRSGVSALLAASRRKLSLVDCTSFEIMRNAGIKTVFAFDSHFKEQGFTCMP
jgi:predicted nucleic acid-binding protein